jgi:UDP:flavonoid glycosyltransferase YjiC (YdhE family)
MSRINNQFHKLFFFCRFQLYAIVTVLRVHDTDSAIHTTAHPNVRLFITHGGLLSTQETIHWGVPVVGIPLLGDQKLNMARAVSAGYGIRLDYDNVTAESLDWALKEVLENSRYFFFE